MADIAAVMHLVSPTPDEARRAAKKLSHEQQLVIQCASMAELKKLTQALEYGRRSDKLLKTYELRISKASGLRIFVQRKDGNPL